jgi:hypothetical protein
MKIKDWFENWGISGLKLKFGFMEMEWEPQPDEQQAAWELYVELITRITTQPLDDNAGDEQTALDSVAKLFPLTRDLLKSKCRKAPTFAKIAIVILNQKIRPFTALWHKNSLAGVLNTPEGKTAFRTELRETQKILVGYTGLLASIAGVEDFLELEVSPLSGFQG